MILRRIRKKPILLHVGCGLLGQAFLTGCGGEGTEDRVASRNDGLVSATPSTDPATTDGRPEDHPSASEETEPESSPEAGTERLVYSSRSTRDSSGALVSFEEEGRLTEDVRRELLQPWASVKDGYVHEEVIWTTVNADGQTVEHYEVVSREFEPVVPVVRQKTAELSPALQQRLARSAPDEDIAIAIRVRGTEAWPQPEVLPAVGYYSAEGYEAARLRREVALEERRRLFEQVLAPLQGYIEASGGRLAGALPALGWATASLPAEHVVGLLAFAETERVILDRTAQDAMGEVSIGDLKQDTRADVQQFHSDGFNGENGSSDPLLLGIIEVAAPEDETCFLDDSSGCTADERLTGKFTCSGSGCSSVSNFTNEAAHGTVVMSIAAGNYGQTQTNPNGSGEPVLPGNWRTASEGFANEVNVHYASLENGSGFAPFAHALECLNGDSSTNGDCERSDVVNMSLGYNSLLCEPETSTPVDDALEAAWLNGTLPVKSAGNQGQGACTTNSPDAPLAFVVGGLNTSDTTSYHTWAIGHDSSIGGADMVFGSTAQVGTVSLVDLAAAYDPSFYTNRRSNDDGTIEPTGGAWGTSYAAPQVAGAAISLKDSWLQNGKTWINTTGYFHANMLNQGDRGYSGFGSVHCGGTDRHLCGADRAWGMGRLKMRYTDAYAVYSHTFNGTSSSHTHKRIFPIPQSSVMVKCSTQQVELMANKNNMSRVTLSVQIRRPVDGTCVVDGGTLEFTRNDLQYDDKHMVSIFNGAADGGIGGLCYQVTLDPTHLSDDNYVTTYAYCHTDDELDYQPN